jgi:hypothetical protein
MSEQLTLVKTFLRHSNSRVFQKPQNYFQIISNKKSAPFNKSKMVNIDFSLDGW